MIRNTSHEVTLGVVNRDTLADGHDIIMAEQFISHEAYDKKTVFNDIALLKLQVSVTLSGF